MDNEKIIIILLCVIILILIVGIFIVTPSLNKEECKLTIHNKEVYKDHYLKVSLSDLNENGISNETIHVTLTGEDGKTIKKDIKTNSKGQGKISINKTVNYKVNCKFEGNNKFKSCSTSKTFNAKKLKEKSAKSTNTSPHTISIVPEFDKNTRKNVGEYTVEATKWKGGEVGGFEVFLYKNGKIMDRNSYESRAYFYMDGEWKWSRWDNGEVDTYYHKYPVSKGVDIKEVEVRF